MVLAIDRGETTSFSMPSDREIVIVRRIDAPRQRVWDAWTRPEHLPRWMLGLGDWTMPSCEIDLRPGGSWHFAWRHHHCDAEMAMRGVYREVAVPERLVSTESWGGDWPETLNTLTFSEEDGGTTIRQSILYPTSEARDAALKTGMKDGMSESLDRLAEYLRSMA